MRLALAGLAACLALPGEAAAASLAPEAVREGLVAWLEELIPPGAGRVTVTGLSLGAPVEVPDGPLDLRPRAEATRSLLGRVSLPVDVWVAGRRARTLNVTFHADLVRPVPVLAARVAAGAEIRAADVALGERPLSSLGRDAVLDAAELVGRTARRDLGPGQAVGRTDLVEVVDGRRGDAVTLRLESPGLRISASGILVHDARIGETVRVVCVATRRELRGTLRDRSTVEVALR
ncbi:flagellar basal body P-ring formation chaperone FlgA [Myxococcota bacterium]|nr:flagellar basal body P-ring formation chaperone FlgA [Myxococcota bacterium]